MSIKITALECPVCGGAIEVTPGSKISYCPYCGTKLLIVDDNEKTVNINQNINKNININKTYEDKAKIEQIRSEERIKENSYSGWDALVVIGSILLFIIGMVIIL